MRKKNVDRQTRKWLSTLTPEQRAEAVAMLRQSASGANRRVVAREPPSVAVAKREACSEPRMRIGVPHREPGMRRGRGRVKYGDAKRGTTRFTPLHAIESEDRYDLMSVERAAACNDEPSITGRQLEYLRMRHLWVQRSRLSTKPRNA